MIVKWLVCFLFLSFLLTSLSLISLEKRWGEVMNKFVQFCRGTLAVVLAVIASTFTVVLFNLGIYLFTFIVAPKFTVQLTEAMRDYLTGAIQMIQW